MMLQRPSNYSKEWNGQLSDSHSGRETYALAIQWLKGCFKRISSKNRDNQMVRSWSVSVGQEYVELLGSRQPMVLMILACLKLSETRIPTRNTLGG
ncbi:hypothetical protein K432DRAFT_387576 [Lepidopterella palustris CBS 459.81]|uniref:Uncharacterized protein n=1 Tax=Lepidopterella palustris CBS 459.81 TaxID=1314670 RepID=A0A8E2DWS5_9PEZI|nr:hypothetical protein K432DRAFT_387576 [Lepidopterella palustris CBS 459.81]